MSNSKTQDWLGLNDHDSDDDQASDQSDNEESRTTGISRNAKRRKVAHRSDSEEESADETGSKAHDEEASEDSGSEDNERGDDNDDSVSDNEDNEDYDSDSVNEDLPTKPSQKSQKSSSIKPLTPEELAEHRARIHKTGVVYLSRIPPFMRPQKVKHLLSRFGTVNRLFLVPESAKSHSLRKRFGGSKKRNYEEGWVEFEDKKVAKVVAETLNAKIVGGKKGGYYHDDVWNIKYLPKFKWHHLQAQIAYENASRQAKLRAEISQATRENKTFLRNVERAKMVENIKESKKRKAAATENIPKEEIEVRRQFRQNKAKASAQKAAAVTTGQEASSSETMKRVLGKIF